MSTTAVKSEMSSWKLLMICPDSAPVSRISTWMMVTRPTMPSTDTGSSSAILRSIPPTSPLRVPWTIPARTNSNSRVAPMLTVVA